MRFSAGGFPVAARRPPRSAWTASRNTFSKAGTRTKCPSTTGSKRSTSARARSRSSPGATARSRSSPGGAASRLKVKLENLASSWATGRAGWMSRSSDPLAHGPVARPPRAHARLAVVRPDGGPARPHQLCGRLEGVLIRPERQQQVGLGVGG